MKVFAYRSAVCRLEYVNLMLPKVVKHNGAHEYVRRQRYYYTDVKKKESSVSGFKVEIQQ